MSRPGLADRQELLRWADSIGSRSELPRLIRKLILETGKGVVELGFPAGEGVGAGDWDGTARATESSAHVPEGLSLWEISVDKRAGKKADEDYPKRTSTPDGTPTSDCTYVAVLLRPWTKRREWARARTEEGRWKQVRAYGVDDVETWLEQAPVTHAWVSEHLGLGPHGLRAGDSWWHDWSRTTDPELPADPVLAGRESAVKTLRSRVAGSPSLTTLKAGSLEEVRAFVAAVAVDAADQGDGQMLAQLAFVDHVHSWRALRDHKQPLVLVPVTPEVIDEARAGSNHHVIVPMTAAAGADIELPAIDAGDAKDALQRAGMKDERRADQDGRLARRSLLSLRRRLATKPELLTPSWAQPPGSRLIRGVLLAGRWITKADGDREVIEELVGKQDDALREALDGLASDEDPLVAAVDGIWALVSPYDAWLQLRTQLDESDLKRFEAAVRRVLLEVDPALDLPEESRWRAAVEGKVRKHSGDLRVGLATSLALLGVHGDEVDSGRGAPFASYLVRSLLEEANKDDTGRIWSSLSGLLPLLAEASPDQFLEAVRTGLKGDQPVLAKLFTDMKGQSTLFSAGSPHTGLLWALENAAWSNEHFGQVIDLLARLHEVDPDGELSNRPARSLAAIYCPWHPENAVSNAERLGAIDGLRKRHPTVAWDLMVSMLPEYHGIHMPTHEPEFRDWKPPREPVTNVEYFELVNEVTRRLIQDADEVAERWATLIESGSNVPPVWNEVRDGLKRAAGAMSKEEKDKLWSPLRAFIARHREFSDTDWALPGEELDALAEIERDLAPSEASAGNAWLFEEHLPDLGSGDKGDYDRYTEDLAERRKHAVASIVADEGVDALLQTARKSPVPGAVGWALADASEERYESDLLDLVDSDDPAMSTLARGFFAKRFRQAGWPWLEGLLDANESLGARAYGRLLLVTDDYPKAWEVAEAQGSEYQQAFWQEFSPLGLGTDYPYLKLTAEKLIAAGRPAAALQLMEMYLRKDLEEPDQLARVMADALDALLERQDEDPELQGLSQYDFQRAFGYLEQHQETLGKDRVARLEWAYLPALGYEPDVQTLHGELAANPEFFVEVVSAVFKPRTEKRESDPSPEQARIAENGYRLLSSWSKVPGVDDDGSVDVKKLKDWVDDALQRLNAADRLEVGADHIGQVLSHAPADPDGAWPCEAVRELLEEIQNEHVEDGLGTQIFNNRGTTSRSPEAGGDQERALAKKYKDAASSFAGRWPRIAAVLRDLEKTYEHDARRLDSEAERRRRGLD
jgi:hypothetical protein